MNRSSLLLAGLTALATLAVSPGARADGPPNPSKHECVEASEAGQDLRQSHKLRAAREKLLICVAEACPGPVREDCAQRLDEVAKAMPSIVFEVKDANGTDATGVTIRIDGQRLAGAGTAIDLDPGGHTFTFAAAGVPTTTEKRLVIVEGVKQRHEVIVLGTAAPATSPPPEPGVAPAPATSPPPEPVVAPAPARSIVPPTLALAAFGVGGASLVLGISAGLVASGKHSTLSGECNDSAGTCAPQYSGDLDSFHTWRTVSTISYVVGALGIVGGGVLWLVAPKARSTTTAHVWFGPASAGVAGAF